MNKITILEAEDRGYIVQEGGAKGRFYEHLVRQWAFESTKSLCVFITEWGLGMHKHDMPLSPPVLPVDPAANKLVDRLVTKAASKEKETPIKPLSMEPYQDD